MITRIVAAASLERTHPHLPANLTAGLVGSATQIALHLLEPEGVWIALCDGGEVAGSAVGASGAAFDPDLALIRCLGELAESCAFAAYEPDRLDVRPDRRADELGADPNILFALAGPQIEARLELNRFWAGYDWLPPPLPTDDPIDWCRLPSLNGGSGLFLPRAFCRRRSLCWDAEGIDGSIDSNGCAAGPDLATARTAALLELIERDATARWWYGGEPAAHLDPALLDHRFQAAIATREHGRPVRFAHLGNRAGIHTVLALGTEGDGSYPALGAASGADASQASQRAWLELVRGELAWTTRQARIAATPTDRIDPADLRALWWARAAAPIMQRRLADFADPSGRPSIAPISPDDVLEHLLSRLAEQGIQVFEQRLTEGDPPVVRLIAPSLAHTKPRLAHPALATGRTKGARTTLPLLV